MTLSTSSRYTLFISVFLSCVSFAIVMPSLWPYLSYLNSTKSFFAWVVAIYSIGEAIGAIFFGKLCTIFSTRSTMLIATLLGALGSLLYILAQLFPSPSPGPVFIFIARFLQGMWTGGSQAIQQSYLAAVLPFSQLTITTVTLNAYACFGFVIGPAFGLAFSFLPPFKLPLGLVCNQLTAPGCFVLLSAIFIVFLFSVVFDEERDRASDIQNQMKMRQQFVQDVEDPSKYQLPLDENAPLLKNHVQTSVHSIQSMLALVVCNFAFFTHFYGFALQETITTPLVQAYYNWSVFDANLLFTAGGACALLAFVFVGYASTRYSDRVLIALSLVLGAIGYALLMTPPTITLSVFRFLLGFFLISIAFPVGRACVVSLYTKLIPLSKQGTAQGIILAVGAIARIIGPFWAISAFFMKAGALIVFGATTLLFLISLGFIAVAYHKLDV